MRCPRRDEVGGQFPGADEWRDNDTCSYCGSLSPDVLMAGLEAKQLTLDPTDKTYKIYVHGIPNPGAGELECFGSTNAKEPGSGWVLLKDLTEEQKKAARGHGSPYTTAFCFGPAPSERFAKFYFQHLSEEQMKRFIELHNAGSLRLNTPGHFYVRPFFMRPVGA